MQIPSTARRFLFKYLWSLFSSCKIASEHPDDFKMCYSCHRASSCAFISELNTFQFSNIGHLSVDVQTSHQCVTAPMTSCLCPCRSLWLHCLLSKTLRTLSELLLEREMLMLFQQINVMLHWCVDVNVCRLCLKLNATVVDGDTRVYWCKQSAGKEQLRPCTCRNKQRWWNVICIHEAKCLLFILTVLSLFFSVSVCLGDVLQRYDPDQCN